MFGSRPIASGVVLLAAVVLALGVARASGGAAPGARYVVQPGDTLWSIAAAHGGDAARGVWEIRKRNDLQSATIVPGQVLALP